MCSFLRQLFLSLERTLYIFVREPNSENCLDLIFAVLPCEKVADTNYITSAIRKFMLDMQSLGNFRNIGILI